MPGSEIERFLTHLAAKKKVVTSIQNKADTLPAKVSARLTHRLLLFFVYLNGSDLAACFFNPLAIYV
jgi:hypothetical protein